MTTDTKVADLPAKWLNMVRILRGNFADAEPDEAATALETAARELEAALARQEADKTAAPVGQEIAYLDLGVGGYIDLGSAMTDEQLAKLPKGRHALGIIGTYGVDGYVAAPPPAPVGQEAVAWRYWSPSGNCWWTRYVAPTEDTSPESTNWEPLYAAPPAAQAVDLEWFRKAVVQFKKSAGDTKRSLDEYTILHILHPLVAAADADIAEADRLLALIDQQAGKGGA